MSVFWRISFFYGFLAQNRPKWPIPPKRNFSLGRSKWESYSPGCTGDMSCWHKSRFPNKKMTFGPKYPFFLAWIAHFCPKGPIGASIINIFNTKEVSLIWGYQEFPPPKKWIFGPKTAKFGPKLAFLAKYQHFWPIWWKNVNKVPRWVFRYVGTKTLTYSQ